MDAPENASFTSDSSAQCGPSQSYIRPVCCGVSLLPLARMEMRRLAHIGYTILKDLRSFPGLPDPVSMTVCGRTWTPT